MVGRFLLEYSLLDLECYDLKNSLVAGSIIYIINKLYMRDNRWYLVYYILGTSVWLGSLAMMRLS